MKPKKCLPFLILALVVAAIGSCATKPKSPANAGPSSIQAEATGLAPSGDQRFQQINFAISIGSGEAVKAWSIAITGPKNAVKTLNGDASNLPESISWDGKNDAGALAPEGMYTAALDIDYGNAFSKASVSSKAFLLDIKPPTATFSPSPATFAYSPDGVTKPITATISVKAGLAKVASWAIDVYDETGAQIRNLSGTWPNAQATWDGKMDNGGYLETAVGYPAVLSVKDEFGNTGTYKGSFAVADVPGAATSSIAPKRPGFSPTSTSVKNSLDLLLTFGSKASVQDWMVTVMSAAKGEILSFKGDIANLPEYVRWDGKDDSGNLAPEGAYYGVLAINYGKAFKPTLVKSRPFSLVTTPPKGSITVDPPTVALATLGPKSPVTLTVQAKSSFAQIASWVMAVYDPSNVSIVVFNANWPNNKIAWDGKTVESGRLIPGATYTIVAKVQDEYGNIGELDGTMVAEGLLPAMEPSSITALGNGFAPTGDKSDSVMNYKIEIGDKALVSAWRVDILGDDNGAKRTFAGTGTNLPDSLTWDGKPDNDQFAPEGSYTARLQVLYGLSFAPSISTSKPFVLDLTPPSGAISLSTDLFSPDGDGTNDNMTISLTGTSKLARIVGWSMNIYDPGNNVFYSKKGSWPADPIVWDGKGASGDLVESASVYPIDVKLRDEFGNVGEAKKDLNTDILVLKIGNGYRIRVSSIYFKSFTADYKTVPADRAAQNLKTLDLLSSKIAKFPDYQIKLEGHAVMINWDNKTKGEAEQKAILIPLSQLRAKAIEAALIDRGIEHERLVTTGVGANDPVVPDSDYTNRWKNRRVEFYLIK